MIKTAIEALRGQPMMLTMVLVQVIFVVLLAWVLREVAESRRLENQALAQIARDCLARP